MWLFVVFSAVPAAAQPYLQVKLSPSATETVAGRVEFIPTLKQNLQQHQATLDQVYPTAKSTSLAAWYALECDDCNKLQVAQQLEAAGLVVAHDLADQIFYVTECGDCPNPQPFNDPLMQPNGFPNPTPYNLSDFSWPITTTGADCAWALTDNTQPNVKFAIVDTEVDEDHEDLQGKATIKWTSPGWQPLHDHGTRVASQAIAHINNGIGMAGACDVCEVELYAVTHTSAGGSGGLALAQGIMAALDDGHKIISYSWSGIANVDDILAELEERDATLIWAGGSGPHGPFGNRHVYQGSSRFVFVGASGVSSGNGSRGSTEVSAANVSYLSPEIAFMAPGNGLIRAENPDVNGFFDNGLLYNVVGSETASASAPYVAAGLAMIAHEYSCLPVGEMLNILKETACTDMPGYNANTHGAGHVNLYEALKLADERYNVASGDVVISFGLTWNNEIRIFAGNLILADGASLDVIGGKLKFHEGYGIIVKDDSRLSITGATLENFACAGATWEGISLDGNAFNKSQVASAPSATLNDVKVVNARVGIRDYGSKPEVNNGGVITVTNSEFINNKTGIASYRATAVGLIADNVFEVNDDYAFPPAVAPDADHIGINIADGPVGLIYNLNGNHFTDARVSTNEGGIAMHISGASATIRRGLAPTQIYWLPLRGLCSG